MSRMSGKPETLPQGSYWRYLGASVAGSSHLRKGLPNQDALASNLGTDAGQLPCIVALSDGHGSPRCFRSELGSSLAVDVFQEVLGTFLAGDYGEDLSLIKRTAEERLPQQVTRRWEELVMADLALHPVPESQWEQLSQELGPEQVARIQASPLLIYGATIFGVALTEHFILYLQLGDGDILGIDANGQATRALPPDERLIANETTSLCQPEAWREFRFRFQVMTEHPPCLLMLSTDGYANAFRDEAGFLQVGSDLLDMLRSEGPEYITSQLPDWLNEASTEGSGDDVTLALLWNPFLLAAQTP